MKLCCFDIRQMTASDYRKWYIQIDPQKQARISRFRQEADRYRAVAADMLARQMVGQWCGVDPASLRFGRNEYGKPFALGATVEFNVSHSGDLVICGVDSCPVGVDVERIRPISPTLAEHICTPEELNYLLAGGTAAWTSPELQHRFFEVWTAKEAYFKWKGTGITDLKSVSVLPQIQDGCCIFRDGYVLAALPESPHICDNFIEQET